MPKREKLGDKKHTVDFGVNTIHRGVVNKLQSHGAWIRLSREIEHFLHVSQIRHGFVERVEDVLRVGEHVFVKVISSRGRIEVSMRDIDQVDGWDYNPRNEVAPNRNRASIIAPVLGSIHRARVLRLEPFGCIVELLSTQSAGFTGLVHISQLMHYNVATVEDVVRENDELFIKVIAKDMNSGKLRLSRKYVNQETGADLDPDGIMFNDEVESRKTAMSTTKVETVARTESKIMTTKPICDDVCAYCQRSGHVSAACVERISKSKRSHEVSEFFANLKQLKEKKKIKKKKKKKKKKKSKKKRSHHHSESSSDTSSDSSMDEGNRNRKKRKIE